MGRSEHAWRILAPTVVEAVERDLPALHGNASLEILPFEDHDSPVAISDSGRSILPAPEHQELQIASLWEGDPDRMVGRLTPLLEQR